MPSSTDGFSYIIYDDYVAIGDGSLNFGNGVVDKNIEFINVPSSINGKVVKRILYRAFGHLIHLTAVTLPTTIETIDADLFMHCNNLRNVHFQEPSQLVEFGGWGFYNCSNLELLVLPSSLKLIGSNFFTECVSLKHVFVPNPSCQFNTSFNDGGLARLIIHVSKCFQGSFENAIMSKSIDCLYTTNIFPKCNWKLSIAFFCHFLSKRMSI